VVTLVVSNTNNSLEKLRKTLEVLLELFEVHLNFVLFFLALFWVGTSVADPDPNPEYRNLTRSWQDLPSRLENF
jgi:hypothetical protein